MVGFRFLFFYLLIFLQPPLCRNFLSCSAAWQADSRERVSPVSRTRSGYCSARLGFTSATVIFNRDDRQTRAPVVQRDSSSHFARASLHGVSPSRCTSRTIRPARSFPRRREMIGLLASFILPRTFATIVVYHRGWNRSYAPLAGALVYTRKKKLSASEKIYRERRKISIRSITWYRSFNNLKNIYFVSCNCRYYLKMLVSIRQIFCIR